MSELIFRCSSLHRLMGNARTIDELLLNEETRAIKAKKKRTEEEQQILDDLLLRTLSAGAKDLVKEMLIEKKYNISKFTGNKFTEKGNMVEDDAIKFFMQTEFISAEKNTKRYCDGMLTGEHDVLSNRIIYDTKCPWDFWSFPKFQDDVESKSIDAGYDWQQHGYIRLLRKEGIEVSHAELKYILMPTPEKLLSKYDDWFFHQDFVLDLSAKDRIKTYRIDFCEKRDKAIDVKIEAARRYAKTLEI